MAGPDFTIRGDPALIRERAATTYAKGQAFYDTGAALSRISTEGWTGRAADHFRDAHDLEPERWTRAGDGFRTAGTALEAYADAVQEAQRVAAWATGEYARGEDVTARARSAYDQDVARARQEVADAAAVGESMTLTIYPFQDPGQAVRDNAVSDFTTAKATLDVAAQTCADQVRAGCRDAPEKPGWLESGLRFVGGIFEGAGEAIWDLLVMVTPLSALSLIDDLYSLATGDLTAEELMTKYRLSVESVGGLLEALQDDPVGFGRELGKGLLDWDTWADDPARAIGHLVPDAIIALATAGSGAAVSGVGKLDDLAGLSKLDDLADLGRLDELGDLSRLDDLGDLGRLDDLGDLGRLDDLSSAEAAAITRYTDVTHYDDLNSYLRGNDPGRYTADELASLSDDVSSGLQRLPAQPGETFRGTNLPDSVLDDLAPGGTFSDPAFFSSSEQASVAQGFRGDGNTMFHIEGQSGRDIQSLSVFNSGEAEILFDKATTFQVVDKVWNDAGGYWDIFLKE